MPVQFPSDLSVADFLEVQILHPECRLPRTTLAMHHIKMPIDLGPVIQALKTQQVEPMLQDSFGSRQNAGRDRRIPNAE